MNSVVLVGRLTTTPEVVDTDSGKKKTSVTIAVSRNFKNADGIYETDFIRCILWNNSAINISEYCKVGDCIGIRGRIQTYSYEDENKVKHYVTDVVAERITFISTLKKSETLKEIAETQDEEPHPKKTNKKK